MKKVQINIYRYKQIPEHKIIEVPENLNTGEVMKLAAKSLTEEENSCSWDWNFMHNTH